MPAGAGEYPGWPGVTLGSKGHRTQLMRQTWRALLAGQAGRGIDPRGRGRIAQWEEALRGLEPGPIHSLSGPQEGWRVSWVHPSNPNSGAISTKIIHPSRFL